MTMRDYDPERDDWTHQVQPRSHHGGWVYTDRETCPHTGQPHEYASGECVLCGYEDPYEDQPSLVHPDDTRDAHMCFAGCRHARTREGRFLRPLSDFDNIKRKEY